MTKKELRDQLISRVKSLVWRAGGVIAVGLLAWLIEPSVVEALNIPPFVVVGAGLIVGEITKFLNNK